MQSHGRQAHRLRQPFERPALFGDGRRSLETHFYTTFVRNHPKPVHVSTVKVALSWLRMPEVRRRLVLERLTEPLHLNIAALFVALFGSTRARIGFDVLPLQFHAYGLLSAVELALANGKSAVTAIEFGVAAGRGLLNMADIAAKLTKETGVRIDICGFDGGTAMPPPIDERDHPDLYSTGDFPMDVPLLKRSLPPHVRLLLGAFSQTIPDFLETHSVDSPIGYVSLDVDYYSSACQALEIFRGLPTHYLPTTILYADDIIDREHNLWCGELLALEEFNRVDPYRKIDVYRYLRNRRIFKNAWWIEQMRTVHVLDHPKRRTPRTGAVQLICNPYLK